MTSRSAFLLMAVALAACAVAAPAAAAPTPRPTPTPEPRLSGGFGKAPAAASPRRRAEKKAPVKLTNDTLVTEPDKGKVSTSNVRPPTPEPTPKGGSGNEAPASSAPSSEDREAYWRGEARRLREQVAALKENIARLEEETKRLESDFYAWDDGSYRDRVIKPAWDKAREELATARRELPLAEKDLADLPDRARRAGALPGWLRE